MSTTRALSLCAALFMSSAVVAVPAVAAPAGTSPTSTPTSATTPRPDAASVVDDATVAPTARVEKLQPALGQRVETAGDSELTVELTSTGSVADAVAAAGGTLVREYQGLALVKVRASRLRALAASPVVTSVREPLDVRASMATELPRPERGNVNGVQALGSGLRQKVGIIGLFDPAVLATEIANGELPAVPSDHRTCISAGVACPFGTVDADYGNAVAEIVADSAPLAELYLAELGGGMDYLLVIDWMAAHGVTTLVHYWSNPYDGPGDGTGFSAGVIDYAVNKGILWINAAGEQGADPMYTYFNGPHWRGYWADTDNDRWLNFKGTDESETAYCGSLVGLRWSDWAASKTDYDLYITDFRANTNVAVFPVATSTPASGLNQATGGAWPIEGNDFRWLCNHDPARGPVYDTNGDNYVSLWVYRAKRSVQSPTNDVLEISVLNGWLEHANSVATAAVPFADTKNPGALVVGAYLDGPSKAWWTSQGPTNDLRQRPDVAIETCIPVTMLGPASGCDGTLQDTAGPSARLAGYAAVEAEVIGATRPADRARWIIEQIKLRTGNTVRTVSWGWGAFDPLWALVGPPSTRSSVLHLRPSPLRVLETRPGSGLIGTSTPGPLPPDSSITLSLQAQGLSPGDVALLNVTLVNPPNTGWAQVYPPRRSYIGAYSNLNVAAVGGTVPNLVAVVVDADSKIALYTSGGGHFVVDLLGQFSMAYGQLDMNGHYVGLDPYEVADTTTCVGIPVGCSGAPVAGGTSIDVPLAGTSEAGRPTNGIPADGTYAAVVSITATPGATGGWASALPGGSTGTPTSSTLNFAAGRTVSNMAVVPITAANGSMRLYTWAPAHFRVDVLGYFRTSTSASDGAGRFIAGTATRLLDTRTVGNTPVASGSATTVNLGNNALWSGTQDVWLNLTSTKAQSAGSLQVAASAGTPAGNHINLSVGGANLTVASSVITRLDQRSAVIRNTMPTHEIADLMGWFTPPEPGPMPDGRLELLTRTDGTELLGQDLGSIAVSGASADGQVLLIRGKIVNQPELTPNSLVTLWNRTTDTLTSVDLREDGSVFASYDAGFRVSLDGSTVLVDTPADGLVAGDTDGVRDLFVVLPGGGLEMVSVNSAEQPTIDPAAFTGMSADGQRVLFGSSNAAGTLGAGTRFVRDRTTGTTVGVDGLFPPGSVGPVSFSADGLHLVARVGPTSNSGVAAGISSLVFVNLATQVTQRVQLWPLLDYPVIDGPGISWVTSDGSAAQVGKYLVHSDGSFEPYIGLESGVQYSQQYWRSADGTVATWSTASPTRVLVTTPLGGPVNIHRAATVGATPNGSVDSYVLAADGSAVIFASWATNLGPAASSTNQRHLYLYHVDF